MVTNKCFLPQRYHDFVSSGNYAYFKPIEGNDGPEVMMEGKKVIMAGSNNYLGLSSDPRVKEAAIKAIHQFGTTNSGSRTINGTLTIHLELEWKLAAFLGKEACMTFTTGYQSNQGTIVPLIGRNDYLISDKENHQSIVQAMQVTKGTVGKDQVKRFRHCDLSHLQEILHRLPIDAGKLIVVDGVFSMTGEIADLPAIHALAKAYQADVMVDDAHGLGVIGLNGSGTESHFGLTDAVDLITGTFSKSLASIGGFVAGKREVIDYLKHSSSAFIFSASPAPAQVAAASKALDILLNEPDRISQLHDRTQVLRNELISLGFTIPIHETPILYIKLGDDQTTLLYWRTLYELGVFVNAILTPAVPEGSQGLRISMMSSHTNEQLEKIVQAFSFTKKQLEYRALTPS
ncbi:aminotransferase class I/II-fold pyridoxal phosphate-dependent enzyme [Bacillus coahuilensis]|uniref:aminotransferase class I/II-fold pyridoxal phosphate-dependent enzyme n=1 Tax=Bacillus coahuilensis TaxID=408580 RepID=UPI0001850B50|nr:pyridoxal phosphate-dependent aminotransferase family protein [Bacillus coahuilensis]